MVARRAKAKVATFVSRALTDKAFIAAELKERAPGANPRQVLCEDPSSAFAFVVMSMTGRANGSPHDHGSSWAIYGQATGVTEA